MKIVTPKSKEIAWIIMFLALSIFATSVSERVRQITCTVNHLGYGPGGANVLKFTPECPFFSAKIFIFKVIFLFFVMQIVAVGYRKIIKQNPREELSLKGNLLRKIIFLVLTGLMGIFLLAALFLR